MPSGIGYGAGVGLQQVLERLMLEAQARQRAQEQAEAFGLQRQGIDLQRRNVELGERRQNFEEEIARTPKPEPLFSIGGRIVTGSGRVVCEEPGKPRGAVNVAPGHTLFDQDTRETIFTAPDKPSEPKPPARFTINGNLIEIGEDGKARTLFSAPDRSTPASEPLVRVQRPDGTVVYVPRSQAAGQQAPRANGSPLDDLISEVLSDGPSGAGGGSTPPAGGGRGAPPPAGGGRGGPPPSAALQNAARQVLQSQGYAATPENIARFLSNPQNRQLLMQGAGAR